MSVRLHWPLMLSFNVFLSNFPMIPQVGVCSQACLCVDSTVRESGVSTLRIVLADVSSLGIARV